MVQRSWFGWVERIGQYPGEVADPEVTQRLNELDATLASIAKVVDVDKAQREITELEGQASAPELWNDQENAQKVTSRLSFLQGEVTRVESLRARLDDVRVLFELAEAESDADETTEAAAELEAVADDLAEMEVRTLLSGEYDQRSALIHVHSGAGGGGCG